MCLVLILYRLTKRLIRRRLQSKNRLIDSRRNILLDSMRRMPASRVPSLQSISSWKTKSSGRASFLSRACLSSRDTAFWSTLKTNLKWLKRKWSMTESHSFQARIWPLLNRILSTRSKRILPSSMTSTSKRRSSSRASIRFFPRTALHGIRTTKSINDTAQFSQDLRSLRNRAIWVWASPLLLTFKATVCSWLVILELREGPPLWCSRLTLKLLPQASAKESSMMKRWSISKSWCLIPPESSHLCFLATVSGLYKSHWTHRSLRSHLNLKGRLRITKVDSGTHTRRIQNLILLSSKMKTLTLSCQSDYFVSKSVH